MNFISQNRFFGVIILCSLYLAAIGCSKKDPVSEIQNPPKTEIVFKGILTDIKVAHPRLLLTDQRLEELKLISKSDSRLQKYVNDVLALADADLKKAPIQHVLIGPRLLDKSREAVLRIYDLSFAYRWTGMEKYYTAAVSNMNTVCAFADWNPSHYLDVAEMTHAVAIGYDWLYGKLDVKTRESIRQNLTKLGVYEGKKAYDSNAWWAVSEYNWNQVCNSGMAIGALSIAESDTTLAAYVLRKAIAGLPYALKSYGPDGVWSEGPGYWGYATEYTAYGMAALKSALNKDFGFPQIKGMNVTAHFPIYSAGPTGYLLNYADAGEKSKLGAPHPSMWLANVYNENIFSDFVIDQLTSTGYKANVWDIIWYRPYANTATSRDLDKFFDGSVALFFSRSSWSDSGALWVGFKAGFNKVNHAHLDLGNFEMDALGQRWFRDLGSDDYNLPDYFGSKRYTYYRLNSLSHNVPVLNGKSQREDGVATFVKHAEGTAEPFGIVDLTSAYKDYASRVCRGIKVLDGKKSILVQDEFSLLASCSIDWGLTTDATIQIVSPTVAELTLGGKKLTATLLSSDGSFSIESAMQAAPQKTNTGVSRLMVKKINATGNVTIAVLLTPQWSGTDQSVTKPIIALNNW